VPFANLRIAWLERWTMPGLFSSEHRFRIEHCPTGLFVPPRRTRARVMVPLLNRRRRLRGQPGFDAMNSALKQRASAAWPTHAGHNLTTHARGPQMVANSAASASRPSNADALRLDRREAAGAQPGAAVLTFSRPRSQRSIGRLSQGDAATIDLSEALAADQPQQRERRKQLAEAAAVDSIDERLLR